MPSGFGVGLPGVLTNVSPLNMFVHNLSRHFFLLGVVHPFELKYFLLGKMLRKLFWNVTYIPENNFYDI